MPTSDDSRARQTVEHFINLHEPSYESLLHYAALPLILTPELLHYLRHAFTPTTPWIAEVDILLAESLCRQYSTYEQYLLHADVRAWLLAKARAEPDFRLADAARVLLHYVEDLQRSRPYKSWRELQAQAWSAMLYIDDEHRRSVVEQIKEAFRRAGAGQSGGDLISEAELERLAHITEMLAPELRQHQALVEYARAVRTLLRNETEVDERAYQPILGEAMPSAAELTGRKRSPPLPRVTPPVKIVVIYSHQDREWLEKLETAFLPLERQGMIECWNDHRIPPGEDWKQALEKQLNAAELILVLASADFLTSEYSSIEMQRALERAETGEARLIPILLDPVDWQDTPLAHFQCLPKDGRPLTQGFDPDQALREVVQEISRVVKDIRAAWRERPSPPPIQNIHGWPPEQVRELQRQTAQALGTPVEFRDTFKERDQQGPPMVVIPGGRFLMGSPPEERGREDEEHQHEVGIITPFAIGKFPVTFEDYDRFCEATGREKPSDWEWGRATRPVIDVSWEDAVAYCAWLSQQTGARYRLPTEAEWEYACRASSETKYCFGDDERQLEDYAWYSNNAGGKTHPVGEKQANAWGLYDVHGNVLEWVQDWYGPYSKAPQHDPSGPESGSGRVIRGGSWISDAEYCRSAFRGRIDPGDRDDDLGFRLARTGPWPSDTLTLARQRAVEPSVRAGSGVERKPAYKAYDGFRDRLKDLSEAPEMVYLPGGTFQMGDSQGKGSENERPVHEVTLDAFALGRYPVTVGEYLRFADATKSHYPQWLEAGSEDHIEKGTNGAYRRVGMSPKNGQHPMVGISWHDAVAYCAWLSKQTGERYALPTEAEWEYACRASSEAAYCFGDDEEQLGDYAWYARNAGGKTHPVGEKRANAWGLYDLHGHVWEWVQDWYGAYSKESQQNPSGPESGSDRVFRGGSWGLVAVLCRSAYRSRGDPGIRSRDLGFRLARRV